MHALSSNRANTIARLALTARLLFQYGVGLGYYSNMASTNYEQCLHLSEWLIEWVSEWVSEWRICISESPQQTRFYTSRIDEFLKPWPNGVASRRKFSTCVYLRLRFGQALRALTLTCDGLRSLWSRSNLYASRRKFFTVWSPNPSQRKLRGVH